MTTDWSSVFTTEKNVDTVANFANGELSGRKFYSYFANTASGGVVRNLLRSHGVDHARKLARKALSRRAS